MKKSFLNATSPLITEMVQVSTASRAENDIRNAVNNGATAIGLQLARLEKQYRTKETLNKIIAASEDAQEPQGGWAPCPHLLPGNFRVAVDSSETYGRSFV